MKSEDIHVAVWQTEGADVVIRLGRTEKAAREKIWKEIQEVVGEHAGPSLDEYLETIEDTAEYIEFTVEKL